ncbi:hypothetical protein GGI21_003580, partial [Coemansia aciculifera]
MTNADELQKRVDTLQKQLRKAGDHLKRLAAENGTLTEQVEKLNEREAQLQTQIQTKDDTVTGYRDEIAQLKSAEKNKDALANGDVSLVETRLGEWETAAKEWAAELGVSDDTDSAAVIQAVKSRLLQATEASGDRVVSNPEEIVELERRIAELELKLKACVDGELAVSSLLSNSELGSVDAIPDTVPLALCPGLELVAVKLRELQAASQDSNVKHEQHISVLETQVAEAQTKLKEATSAREELAQDYDHLLQRIGTMKDALTAKMSGESDELKRLRKELAGAKSATASAERAVTQSENVVRGLEKAAQTLRSELDDTKRALWESQETANRVQSEYDDSVDDSTRQLSALQAKLQATEAQLEADSVQRDQLEDRVEQLQSDLNQALNAEGQWVGEREVHLVTIQNLQGALEHLQVSKDAEVDMAVETLRDELRTTSKDLKAAVARAERAESQLRRTELNGASAEQSQQRIAEQVKELERLRHEVAVLKDHLNESMRRLREESSEFNLDKRVITNLIVGFLALPYGDSKRFEILQLMSSILQFTEEQQEKAGLIRKAG